MKRSVQIGAVQSEIGCAVARLGISAERDLGEAFPRELIEDGKIAEGLKATCSIASNRPSFRGDGSHSGPSWMPAPVSSRKSERSSTVAVRSRRASASAAGKSADSAAGN